MKCVYFTKIVCEISFGRKGRGLGTLWYAGGGWGVKSNTKHLALKKFSFRPRDEIFLDRGHLSDSSTNLCIQAYAPPCFFFLFLLFFLQRYV